MRQIRPDLLQQNESYDERVANAVSELTDNLSGDVNNTVEGLSATPIACVARDARHERIAPHTRPETASVENTTQKRTFAAGIRLAYPKLMACATTQSLDRLPMDAILDFGLAEAFGPFGIPLAYGLDRIGGAQTVMASGAAGVKLQECERQAGFDFPPPAN